MGRPSNGIPYLKGGVYHIRFQGDKGTGTSLNTTSARDAQKLAEDLARKRGKTMPSLVKGRAPSATLLPTHSAVTVPVTGASPSQSFAAASGDALDSWLGTDSEFDGQAPQGPEPGASASPGASQEALSLA